MRLQDNHGFVQKVILRVLEKYFEYSLAVRSHKCEFCKLWGLVSNQTCARPVFLTFSKPTVINLAVAEKLGQVSLKDILSPSSHINQMSHIVIITRKKHSRGRFLPRRWPVGPGMRAA